MLNAKNVYFMFVFVLSSITEIIALYLLDKLQILDKQVQKINYFQLYAAIRNKN